MVKFYDSCPLNLLEWIQKQHIFYVSTAPLASNGHVNVSPKGAHNCFHVVGPNKVWYEDLSGSGCETIAHLRENRRITIMFTAFDGPPRIVRLFGTGTVHEFGSPEYAEYIPKGTREPGSRSAIVIDVHKASSSCGYSIPFYDFRGERTQLHEFFVRREKADAEFEADHPTDDPREVRAEKGLRNYWLANNARSIDGLPGVLEAPYAPDTPSSTWTREEGIARSNAAVSESGRGISNKLAYYNFAQLENSTPLKVAAGFALGVMATLTLMNMRQLFMLSGGHISEFVAM
ncbi:hypothetical protein M0805_004073 [Coniferiporia weirii]|nr:hypothetical protein M0805_004073 [Coniferiporia weirii]